MKTSNRAVALITAFLLGLGAQLAPSIAQEQTQTLDLLFSDLAYARDDEWQGIENKIWKEWSKSGSAAMDLLLERGKAEMEAGNVNNAIGHFSALIDHAPDFAEGWNARATAFFVAERYGLAIVDIRQTLLLEPRHFGALSGLGMIYERMDRPADALKVFQEALKIHPNRPDVIAAIERLEEKVEGITL